MRLDRRVWIDVLGFIALVAILAAVFALHGCAGVRTPDPAHPLPTPTPLAAQLAAIGVILLWAGAAIAALGIGLRIALAFSALGIFGALAPLIPVLLSVGAGTLAIGAALTWLSYNLWLLGAAVIATVVALAVHHRRHIRDWLVDREEAQQPAAGVKPPC